MLTEMSLKDFIDELASNSPAPGGGSAAALSAALANALASMVFNLTIGKKLYNEYDEEKKEMICNSLKATSSNSNECLDFMDRDAEVFLKLMDSFKLPRVTEEDKKIRSEKIQMGYKEALEVPLELAQKAYKIYDYIYIACQYGNENAVSDAGVAALLTQTAIESAALNVNINLAAIKDENYKNDVQDKINHIVRNGLQKKNDIMAKVNEKIGI